MSASVRMLVLTVLFTLIPLGSHALAQQAQVRPRLAPGTEAITVRPGAASGPAAIGNPAADLGYAAAIPGDEKIQRLQKRVAELVHQVHALQKQYDSLNASLGALAKATVTFRCESAGGEARSVNSLGAAVGCSPYACNPTTGKCYQPLCANTEQCLGGFACDVGQSNLCVSTR